MTRQIWRVKIKLQARSMKSFKFSVLKTNLDSCYSIHMCDINMSFNQILFFSVNNIINEHFESVHRVFHVSSFVKEIVILYFT